MAILDDIFSILLIFFITLIVVGLFSVFITNQTIEDFDRSQSDYQIFFYDDSFNSFLNLREKNTGISSFNFFEYLVEGNELIPLNNGSHFNVSHHFELVLNNLYGVGNYELVIDKLLTNFYISYVFDSSETTGEKEREFLFDNYESIENYIKDSVSENITINRYFYSLDRNILHDSINIKRFNYGSGNGRLYSAVLRHDNSNSVTLLRINNRFHANFFSNVGVSNAIRNSPPDSIQRSIRNSMTRSDWMAGIQRAEDEYRSIIKNSGDAEFDNSQHIIFVVTDKMASGFTGKSCFDKHSTLANWRYCYYCGYDTACSEANLRSRVRMTAILNELNHTGTVVVPILSRQYSINYSLSTHLSINTSTDLKEESALYTEFTNLTVNQTVCELSSCQCEQNVDNENSLYQGILIRLGNKNCVELLKNQLNHILRTSAKNQNLDIINVDDLSQLENEISKILDNIISKTGKYSLGSIEDENQRDIIVNEFVFKNAFGTDVRVNLRAISKFS